VEEALNMAVCLMLYYRKPTFQTMGQVDKEVSLLSQSTASNFDGTNKAGNNDLPEWEEVFINKILID
jgi:hypothetical protein